MTSHADENEAMDWGAPKFIGDKTPGVNVDPIDVAAGLRALSALGWSPEADPRTFMVVEFCLMRWARGEEAQAERQAIAQGETDPAFIEAAIDLTSWRVVLAAAMATGQQLLDASRVLPGTAEA